MDFSLRANKHFSRPLLVKLFKNLKGVNCKVVFNKGCNYYSPELSIQQKEQINKLVGFSDGLFVHRNSFRVGWRANTIGDIELFAYFYKNGKRPSLPEIEYTYYLGSVSIGEPFDVSINKVSGSYGESDYVKYIVRTSKTKSKVLIEHKSKKSYGWFLKPYIGGKATYPNDMSITINEKSKKEYYFKAKGFK